MKNTSTLILSILLIIPFFLNSQTAAEKAFEKRKASLKADVQANVEKQAKLAQVIVDKVFSFSELGFQEVETSKYLTKIFRFGENKKIFFKILQYNGLMTHFRTAEATYFLPCSLRFT